MEIPVESRYPNKMRFRITRDSMKVKSATLMKVSRKQI